MKVSVIIPVYNRPQIIIRAIESVESQTFDDFEIIVVDDGSTDDTRDSIRDVILIETDHSGMPGKARNIGAAAATGEYLAFLDSDDQWLPEKLDVQLKAIQEQNVRFCHTEETWIRDGNEVSQSHRIHPRRGDLFEACLRKCIIGPSTVMMERSLFEESGGFREDLEICEDYEYWLRLIAKHPVGWCGEFLTIKHGGHEDQLSTKYGQIEIFHIKALHDLVQKGFENSGHQEMARAVLSEKCKLYAKGCRKRGRNEEAEKYEAMAFANE